MRLCDGTIPDTRDGTMARYRGLVEAGQIRFVTFHQSYAYEDFVEGLRPRPARARTVRASGWSHGAASSGRSPLWRSKRARRARPRPLRPHRTVRLQDVARPGRSEDHIYEAAISGGYALLGWGGSEDWSDPKYEDYQAVFDRWNQIEPGTSGNSGNIVQLWRFRSMQVGDLIVVSEGNLRFRAVGEVTGPYRYDPTDAGDYAHRRDVRWLLVLDEPLPVEEIYDKQFSQASCYRLADEHLKQEALARLLPGAPAATGPAIPDQFVLVIDEINRANISKVFGELITLIEPDKRLGRPGEITVAFRPRATVSGFPTTSTSSAP